MLEEDAIDELIDPRLENSYSEQEVYCMLQAASLCIKRDPQLRPRMSQVLLKLVENVFNLLSPRYKLIFNHSKSSRVNKYLFDL